MAKSSLPRTTDRNSRQQSQAERCANTNPRIAIELYAPIGLQFDPGFEGVQVLSQAVARMLDLASYLVRCFAHSISSFTVSTVCSGTAWKFCSLALPRR